MDPVHPWSGKLFQEVLAMRIMPFLAAGALAISLASFARPDDPKPRPYTLVVEGAM
jgi:hypothetical protein